MDVCYFCNTKLAPWHKTNYDKCSSCGTLFSRINVTPEEYVAGELKADYVKKILNLAKTDHNHYEGFNRDKRFSKFKNSISFRNIHSFGGGVPKLESYLTSDHIFSYDANGETWIDTIDTFCELYHTPKNKVTINTCFVTPELISGVNIDQSDLVAFVHFLEHFQPETVKSFIEAIPVDVLVMIYQPNSARAISQNWCHYHREHLFLPTIDGMCYALGKWFNIEIVTKFDYSNDFFLVFKKTK